MRHWGQTLVQRAARMALFGRSRGPNKRQGPEVWECKLPYEGSNAQNGRTRKRLPAGTGTAEDETQNEMMRSRML